MRCADRIATELKECEQDFARLLAQEDYEELDSTPLAVTSYTVQKIELSWGGPADWLEVWHRSEDIHRVIYHFADWLTMPRKRWARTHLYGKRLNTT